MQQQRIVGDALTTNHNKAISPWLVSQPITTSWSTPVSHIMILVVSYWRQHFQQLVPTLWMWQARLFASRHIYL